MAEDEEYKEDYFARGVEILLALLLIVTLFNMILPRLGENLKKGFSDFSGKKEATISLPPRSISEEKALLGAFITNRLNAKEAFGKLPPDSFSEAKNKLVFSALKSLYDDKLPISVDSLSKRLVERGDFSNAGGDAYLLDLVDASNFEKGESFFGKIGNVVRVILLWIAVISIIGISYTATKLAFLGKEQAKLYLDIMPKAEINHTEEKWKKIVNLANSNNPSDRKVAIIEADTILHDMVKNMGYSGDTLGEKLKNIEISDFSTLDDAWEAHKFRNKITHEGIEVSKRDAVRIMLLYEKVFREFEYI
jgi:hypothetical protein